MKKALLIAGGAPPCGELLLGKIESGKYGCIAAADSGANVLYKNNTIPNIIFGDMDSIDQEAKQFFSDKCVLKKYPVKKDDTDLTLCLKHLVKMGYKEICILGALGMRTDHTLGNIMCLKDSAKKNVKIIIENEIEKITLHERPFTIYNQKGSTVSFFAFFKKVKGLSLKGFEYPLSEYTLDLGDMLCISNVIKTKRATVSFKSGSLLMILEK